MELELEVVETMDVDKDVDTECETMLLEELEAEEEEQQQESSASSLLLPEPPLILSCSNFCFFGAFLLHSAYRSDKMLWTMRETEKRRKEESDLNVRAQEEE